MKAEVMSAGIWFTKVAAREQSCPQQSSTRAAAWDPEEFAWQQIRGLVRQVFFRPDQPVRQVVFTTLDSETDVNHLCRRVGEALALETTESIAVVGKHPQAVSDVNEGEEHVPLRRVGTVLRGNLWLLPGREEVEARFTNASLHSYLNCVRREFGYSIVTGSPAGGSNDAIAMAHVADGIVLVVAAMRTRRVVAQRIKRALDASEVRVLGTVLTEREFPIPERIYRRL